MRERETKTSSYRCVTLRCNHQSQHFVCLILLSTLRTPFSKFSRRRIGWCPRGEVYSQLLPDGGGGGSISIVGARPRVTGRRTPGWQYNYPDDDLRGNSIAGPGARNLKGLMMQAPNKDKRIFYLYLFIFKRRRHKSADSDSKRRPLARSDRASAQAQHGKADDSTSIEQSYLECIFFFSDFFYFLFYFFTFFLAFK